jgi:flagellar motor switch protein FliM
MENVLSQQEIDALVRAARTGSRSAPQAAVQRTVEPWDPGGSSQIGSEQMEAITTLHEGFARNLTNALGAYLRVVFSTTLVSAEHLTYREFLESVPDTTYLASCRLNPMGAMMTLQLDLKIAFAIIDLLLGGEGAAISAVRELTDIEVQILDSVTKILCRELGLAWQALALEVSFERRLEANAARRLMAPEDKVLCLSFEMNVAELRGNLNIAVPVTVSHALLRKLSADWSRPGTGKSIQSRQHLMHLLLDCPVMAELAASSMPLPVRALSAITPGEVIGLGRSTHEPASLSIAGREMFRAAPVRVGARRAGRLLERPQEPATTNEKMKAKA